MSNDPQARGGEPRPLERSANPGLVSRLRDWWWGKKPEVEMEEPPWRKTIHPPGPGVKIAELCHYFRNQWREFVFSVAVGVAVVVVVALVGLD